MSWHANSLWEEDAIIHCINNTILAVVQEEDEVKLVFADGTLHIYHEQDCCEHVWLEDVTGDLSDLVGHPLLELRTSSESGDEDDLFGGNTSTWTFITIRNMGGSVDLRFCGTSNGYYSENADIRFTFNK